MIMLLHRGNWDISSIALAYMGARVGLAQVAIVRGLSNELCRQEDLRFYAQNVSDKEFFFASFTEKFGIFDFGVFCATGAGLF